MALGISRFFCYAMKLFTVVICECNIFVITTVKKYITWLLDFQDLLSFLYSVSLLEQQTFFFIIMRHF
jgi:hypothetical protein